MGMTISGFDDLFGTLDALGQVGNKAGKKAVRKGLTVAVKSLRRYAPRDSGDGADSLKVISVKAFKSGGAWGNCGIDSSNWEEAGHLWYQNYGYENNGLNGRFHGRPVTANVGWFNEAVNKCENEAQSVIINELEKEIDKVLR
ncbi:hypothetical protein [uncultured Clostridium sp.]|jgi:hypothetical protein|uniref:hypothetical protein n=1 Tax=uncultured Clostridium sp. TaxID=59620 RepID=UPI0025F2DE47|nr:hypothetical protein [uncultured Clostridium sp.]